MFGFPPPEPKALPPPPAPRDVAIPTAPASAKALTPPIANLELKNTVAEAVNIAGSVEICSTKVHGVTLMSGTAASHAAPESPSGATGGFPSSTSGEPRVRLNASFFVYILK